MIMYIAGNSGHGEIGVFRETIIKTRSGNRLLSFFWYGPVSDNPISPEQGDFFKHIPFWIGGEKNVLV